MKSSWRWGPLIGGCRSFLKVLRTGMTYWADFFAQKTSLHIYLFRNSFFGQFCSRVGWENCNFLKAFFICSFWGAVTALLLVTPQIEQCSPKWTIAVTAILLVAPQNEQRSPKWTIAVPALHLVAPQNERSLIWTFEEKKPLENGIFALKHEQNWSKKIYD